MKFQALLPLFLLTAPMVAEEAKGIQNTPIYYSHSSEFINALAKDHKDGKYKSFLKSLDKNYKSANHKWQYNSLLEQRKEKADLLKQYDGQIENVKSSDPLKEKQDLLKRARDQKILKLCKKEGNSPFAVELKKNLQLSLSDAEQEGLNFYESLKNKFKGDGKTPLENQLIGLDIEFFLKSFELDLLLVNNKLDKETFQKRQCILELEKFSQMQMLCMEHKELQTHFEILSDLAPKLQMQGLIEEYLEKLGNGQINPQTDLDHKLKKVILSYQEEKTALLKKFFPK
ncbi:MAG: hypothetical protein KAR79_05030 [Simkaniaceae bacterium]|nr:hypothetical protein [Simkaniaceae bacterium]